MIGIIGAMTEEVQELKDLMTDETVYEKAGKKFYKGKIGGKEVVVVQCGIGKVNAAICAQMMIDQFDVDYLINTGVAGSLNNDIDVCDIVVSKRAIQHDFSCGDVGNYEVGEIPKIGTKYFIADDRLIDIAKSSVKKANLNIHVFEGTVVTGDQFISDHKKKNYLVSEFAGDCCEMEGGAIAQVAYLNDIPFVIIRAISDKADGEAVVSFDEFVEKAADNSIALLKEMIKQI